MGDRTEAEDDTQAHKAIHQALSADPFDATAYDRALNASLERGTAARAGHHAFMIELAAELTPEHRAKLASFAGRKR